MKHDLLKTSAKLAALSPFRMYGMTQQRPCEAPQHRPENSPRPDFTFQFEQFLYYIAANGSNDIFLTQSSDSVNWSRSSSITGQSSPFTPATVTAYGPNDKPVYYLVYVANNGSNDLFITSSGNGTTFGGTYAVPGQSTRFAPAVALVDNNSQMTLVFVANNGTNDLLAITTTNLNQASSAADLKWGSAITIPGQQSSAAPTVTAFFDEQGDFQLVCAFVANNGSRDLLIVTSPDGIHWSGSQTVSNQQSALTPALTSYIDEENDIRLVMAYVANNGSNDLFITTSLDAVNWTVSNPVTGQSSKLPPALYLNSVGQEGVLVLAYVAANGSKDLLVATSTDSKTWTTSSTVSGQSSNQSPCLGLPTT